MRSCLLPPASCLLQDFPYNFEQGVEHYVLWSTKPLPQERIEAVVAAQLPDQETLARLSAQAAPSREERP